MTEIDPQKSQLEQAAELDRYRLCWLAGYGVVDRKQIALIILSFQTAEPGSNSKI